MITIEELKAKLVAIEDEASNSSYADTPPWKVEKYEIASAGLELIARFEETRKMVPCAKAAGPYALEDYKTHNPMVMNIKCVGCGKLGPGKLWCPLDRPLEIPE